MKKRSCRRTASEQQQHERATRVRRMTDAQLCDYLDDLAAGQRPEGPTKEEIIQEFLLELSIRREDGLRVSDTTLRKMKAIAKSRGFLPEAEDAK